MNYAILLFALVLGVVIGAAVWHVYRNVLATLLVIILIPGMVAFALPWNVRPLAESQRAAPTPEPIPKAKNYQEALEPYRPVEVPSHGYVGSDSCQECHVDNHASWFASYHRTMTQVARPSVVLGDFDNVRITQDNREYVLTRTDEACMVEMPDFYARHDPSRRVQLPIVMTTGSHHMQLYWFANGSGRAVNMLPLAHLNETKEWIPTSASLLKHPSFPEVEPSEQGIWNHTCSECHSTHRKARRSEVGGWDTHVAEFGISCEACHGPGEQHIAFRQNLAVESRAPTDTAAANDPMVNPEGLSKVKSGQVCGQCHSMHTTETVSNVHGHSYRPGKDLLESHEILERDTPRQSTSVQRSGYANLESMLLQTYYRDGMVRVVGREYNGLIRSSCYLNGEMTCLSCHQMHKADSDSRSLNEWANDQLRPLALDDNGCTQCHSADQYASNHTHHPVGTPGATCYNCHMPHTVYGLLKSVRSHTISSPDIAKDRDAQRPNACNLCHLDKTLQWSADYLSEWYGHKSPDFAQDEQEIAASLLWLVKGDAAQRALTAWSMGWSDAQQTSGNAWQAPFLAPLLNDDYPAIRLIARRSLQSLPGLGDLQLDVTSESGAANRRQVAMTLIKNWSEAMDKTLQHRSELLIDPVRGLQIDRMERLNEQRDHTRMSLNE